MTAVAAPAGVTLPTNLDTQVPEAFFADPDVNEALLAVGGLNRELQPAAEALHAVHADPDLSEVGRAREAGRRAAPLLKAAAAAEQVLAIKAAALARRAEAIQPATLASPSEREERVHLALLQGLARSTPEVRAASIERAALGQDPLLATAIVHGHPLLHGVAPEAVAVMRARLLGASDATAEEADELREVARRLARTAGRVRGIREVVEAGVDRDALRDAGAPLILRMRDLTTEEKLEFIRTRGHAAYAALPY